MLLNIIHASNGTLVIRLPIASSSDIEIGEYARIALKAMFRKGLNYKKTGIMAMEICGEEAVQGHLMDRRDRAKEDRLMQAKDKINARWGKYGKASFHRVG